MLLPIVKKIREILEDKSKTTIEKRIEINKQLKKHAQSKPNKANIRYNQVK